MTVRYIGAWLFGCIGLLCCNVGAQTISGKVVDALTKTPLVGAKITVLELKKETATDSTGFFKLDTLGKGNYSVRIEMDKYLRQTKSVKLIGAKGQAGATDISLDIVLFSISSNADQSSGQLTIQYFFPGHFDAEINVSDSTGKIVRTVFDRTHANGMRTFHWNGADNKGKLLLSGRYSCKIKCGNLISIRALVWNGEEKE
jgi:hypothetical protein